MKVLSVCQVPHCRGLKNQSETMHIGQQAQDQIQVWGGAIAVAHFWGKRLNGFFLSLHDVGKGGIAWLIQPQISCDDSR